MQPFTHIYCDHCEAINPANRKKNGIYCENCLRRLLRLDSRERGKCEISGFEELEHEALIGEDVSRSFLGGDIMCTDCRSILATVYKPKLMEALVKG